MRFRNLAKKLTIDNKAQKIRRTIEQWNNPKIKFKLTLIYRINV